MFIIRLKLEHIEKRNRLHKHASRLLKLMHTHHNVTNRFQNTHSIYFISVNSVPRNMKLQLHKNVTRLICKTS